MLQDSSVTATVSEVGNWQYWLQIEGKGPCFSYTKSWFSEEQCYWVESSRQICSSICFYR